MSHDQVRPLLPAYAAGALDAERAAAIRAHLAAGCAECLQEALGRPVATPRPAAAAAVPAAPRAGRRRVWPFVLAAVAAGTAAAALWILRDQRLAEANLRLEAERLLARLEDALAERAELAARVARLDRDLAVAEAQARAEAERARTEADAVRAQEETTVRLGAELDAARARIDLLTRGVRRRDRDIGRLAEGLEERVGLRQMMATPGLTVVPLRAVAPFRDAHGHVLWNASGGGALLYAFALPRLPEGASYRIRFGLDGGRSENGPRFRPEPAGEIMLGLQIDSAGLRSIEIVLDPAAQTVLAGLAATTN